MNKSLTGWVILAVGVLTVLPYGIALAVGQPDYVFGGFLLNPQDGNSYLAKMMQGWQGSWQFQLPFTPEKGQSSYLFTYYLFLGHVARWLHLPIPVIYHLARIVGSVLYLFSLRQFYLRHLSDRIIGNFAFLLAALGGGLGWLAFGFGLFTADFWVAEAYPFLSIYANPHFPLGMAILLNLFSINLTKGFRKTVWILTQATLLSIVFPFAVIVFLAVESGLLLWRIYTHQILDWQKVVTVAIGGMPYIFYQYLIILSDGLLAKWNLQNLTPSPAWWDILIAFSPALILAIFSSIYILRKRDLPQIKLVIWLAASLVLSIMPFGLQRRFLLGMYVPVVGLAVEGIPHLFPNMKTQNYLKAILLILSVPTIVLVILSGVVAAIKIDPMLYLTTEEYEAATWLRMNTRPDTIIFSSPQMGMYLPAYSGRKVLYGHPFETVNAEDQKEQLEQTLHSEINLEILSTYPLAKVDFLFWGPRERAYGGSLDAVGLPLVYQSQNVLIYSVPQED